MHRVLTSLTACVALAFSGFHADAAPIADRRVANFAVPPEATPSTIDRLLSDARITESSGLARSTRRAGWLVTHNDSGDRARLFVVGPRGRTRAQVTVGNAAHLDWEDLAAGPRHTLWIGDTGDNAAARSSVTVYRVVEPPGLGRQRARATAFRFVYPDGPHDAETLMIKPRTSRVHIVTKVWPGNGAVYAAPRELRAGGMHRLTRVRAAPAGVTAGDFTPNGFGYALRDYSRAFVYRRGSHVRTIGMPDAPQAESLTWTARGRGLLSGTEGTNSAVYRIPLN
jgi:hypothetical protein